MIQLKPGDIVNTIHADYEDEMVGVVEYTETKMSQFMTDMGGDLTTVDFVTIRVVHSPLKCLVGSLQTFERRYLTNR